ncbi:uncharacterized protein LOC143285424 [Babylonia areolata]|uniref:uncharacterized protein LOC143285424 n=1 Tax=Babylonia areolata TaxID=304850 RepID=UPI003FD001C7
MVVREQHGDGSGQASVHSQMTSTMMMSTARNEDEEDSGSSMDIPTGGQRKRNADVEPDDERELKRQKNREAAKRCRDKKQKQTEDLKHKNSELEQENCQLAKQRDELIRKCKEYQREIEQHKQQGCMVPHFNPPFNLDHLLQPSSPPSPSFSESAPSTNSCPSPAPSISPGPPARYLPPFARSDPPKHPPFQDDVSSGSINNHASVPPAAPQAKSKATQDSPHYLRVRNKDGTHKILCLDHDNYLKVMHRLKAQRAAAAKVTESEPHQHQTSPVESAVDYDAQSQETSFKQEQPETQNNMNSGKAQSPFLPSETGEQETNPKPVQKLDTCEDLLSILRTHVKDNGNGFEMTPVSEDDVQIKQEVLDAEYEKKGFQNLDKQVGLTDIKQEDTTTESSETWPSTGQQIRASLDTLTNQDDLSSTNARIQNIVQYLERAEHTMHTTGTSTVKQPGQPVRQNLTTQTPSARPTQMATFVVSSASVGALNKMNAEGSHASSLPQQNAGQKTNQSVDQRPDSVQGALEQQKGLPTRPRPNAGGLVTSASMAPGRKQQAAFSVTPPGTEVTSSSSMTPSAGSMQMNQGTGDNKLRMQLMPGQQHPLNVLQHDSAIPYSHPPSSTIDTSAIAPQHLRNATSTGSLMSESTTQIVEYLKANSIETMDS